MELTTRLTARLAHELRGLRGTEQSFALTFGDVYAQAASFVGDAVLIEITGEKLLAAGRRLSAAQQDELRLLGFNRPTDDMPNWWIWVEDGHERALYRAAGAAVAALTGIHGVPADAIAEELPLAWVSPYPARTPQPRSTPTAAEGDAIGVRTTYGDVLLYPNGFATLNGEQWADNPVREWRQLGDGRLSISMAIPGGDHFMHAGFVADTPENRALLGRFAPSKAESEELWLRLAAAEHYALTCIVTGSLYHFDLFWAANNVSRKIPGARSASEIAGWAHAPRLGAAEEAVGKFWFSHSADNTTDLRSDHEATWRAIQTWVRLSPWKDDHDFEIIPDLPRLFASSRDEVEIQRCYPT